MNNFTQSFTKSKGNVTFSKFMSTIVLMITLLLANLSFGQNAIVGAGFSTGWGVNNCTTAGGTNFKYASLITGVSGTGTYGVTTVANGTGNQYMRFGKDWSSTFAQYAITPGTDTQITPNTQYSLNTTCTNSGSQFINVGSTSYNYVFKTINAGTAPTGTFVMFEVQGAVRSATSTARTANIANQAVTVTANLDGVLSTGQAVYIRYTNNAFSTSTVVQMTGSGTTYTGTIPASINTAGANVSYYIFTSGTANVASNGSNTDLYTINLLNNAGANYTYSIASNPVTVASTTGTGAPFTTYATLASAVTAINAGVLHTGTITCYVNAGYTETAPVGGYSIIATGTLANPITFVKNGTGTNPILTAPLWVAGGTTDGIIKIVGGDYITIDGFTIQENASNIVTATGATNTVTEVGIGLFLTTATNGAQNNTIQNCTISLNSTYPNSIGIFSTSSSSSINGALAASATTGTNSNNKIYSNIINNVALGINVICEPITSTINESGWDIGGSSAGTANTITFGSPNTATTNLWNRFSSSTQGAIVFRNGVGVNIRYNTITSNSVSYPGSSFGGILISSGTAPTGITYSSTISDNNITLTNNGTTSITGIDFGHGIATGTIAGSNNTIVINQNAAASNSAAIIGLKASYTHGGMTVGSNNITINQNTSAGALTSPVTGINAAGTSANAITSNVNSNIVTIKQNAPTGTGSYGTGTITYIDASGVQGIVNVNSNQLLTTGSTIRSIGSLYAINHNQTVQALTLNLNTITIDRVAASGNMYGTYSTATPSSLAETLTNNTFTYTSLAGTTAAYGINSLDGASSSTPKTVTGNTVNITGTNTGITTCISVGYMTGNMNTNAITINNASTALTGIDEGFAGAGAITLTGNTFNLVSSSTAATTIKGINTSSAATGPFQIYSNTFTNLESTGGGAAAPTITAIVVGVGSGNNIYTNTFTSLKTSGASPTGAIAITAISVTGGTTTNIYSNTISNISTGASSGNGTINGIAITGGTTNNIYKNKIYDLATSCTGTTTLISDILLSGASSTNTVYNNVIGQTNALTGVNSVDAIRGISLPTGSTTNTNRVYFNTVYLSATSTGTNFGTSALYQISNATATTAALDSRNNIFINNSTAAGTGLSVALRRSTPTLTNYPATASNSNNRNLYYAGTPGASNLIYYDGTNSDQTLLAFQTRMATRDADSQTENTTFQSTAGSNANFLRIAAGTTTYAESGAAATTTPAVTDDYWAIARPFGGGTTYDMGASEFNGITALVPCVAPSNQATGFVAGAVTSNTASATFTAATSAPTGYLVVISHGALDGLPVDGTSYTIGNAIGTTGAVVQMSSSTSIVNATVAANTIGTVTIFSYKLGGCSGGPKYNTSSPLVGTNTTCAANPISLTTSATTATGFTANWSIAPPPASYADYTTTYSVYVYSDSGFTTQIAGSPFTTTVTTATSASLAITGLSSATTYYWKVKANNTICDNTLGLVTGPSVTTACATISTFPYTEGFEGITTANTLPACMDSSPLVSLGTKTRSYIASATGTNSALIARTGSKFVSVNWSPSATGGYFFSPALQLTGGVSYTATVYYKTDGTAWTDATIYYGTSATTGAMTNTVATVANAASTTYAPITGTFTPATTGVYYVAFRAFNSTTSPNYCSFDDFSVDITPSCSSAPASISATTAITTTDATINWAAGSPAPASGYEYYYSTSATAPTAGTTVSGSVGAGVLTANISSLTAATTYYVWVRANCDGTNKSSWTGSGTFVTACSVPNDATITAYTGVTATGITLNYTAASPVPTTYVVFRSTSATPPTLSNGTVYASGTTYFTNYKCILNSTALTIADTGLTGNTQYYYYVYSQNSTNTCFGAPWYSAGVSSSQITCPAAPTAFVNSAITTTGATISWTASAGGSAATVNYTLEVYTGSGYTGPVSGSPFSVGTPTTFAVTGLSAATTYYYRVKANNGACDSAYLSSGVVTTLCNPITSLPWTEGFEGVTIGTTVVGTSTSLPNCWNSGDVKWSSTNATTYNTARTGSNYIRYAWSSTNAYVWSPGFQLTAGTSYDFSFYAQGDGYTTWVNDVFVNSSQSSTGATQVGASYSPTGPGSQVIQGYNLVTRTFVPSSTGVYYFAIRGNQPSGTPWYMAFDDFKLDLTPLPITITPSSAIICNGTSTSLTASSAAAYTYAWSPATGLSATTGATVTASPTITTTYTVTGTSGAMVTTQTVTVTVNSAPTALVITPATSSICPGAIQTITSSGGSVSNITILSENFNSNPITWTQANTSTGGTTANASWSYYADGATLGATPVVIHSNDSSKFVGSDSDLQGASGTLTSTRFFSPYFSTLGMTSVNLSFWHYFRYGTTTGEFAKVQYTIDGTNYTDITGAVFTSTQGTATSFVNVSVALPAAVLNKPQVRIRFSYNGVYAYYWAIDNVSITGTGSQVTWNPINDLYVDAAATTTPYTAGTVATTVYSKATANRTYTATVTAGTCSVNSNTATITVKTPVAITSATAASSLICLADTTTLTANGVVGDGATVTWWSATGGTGTSYGTGLTKVLGPGTYYARVTGDCGAPVEASVTVGAKVNVGITGITAGANPICASATTTLTANGVVGTAALVTWWTGTGGTGTNLGTGTTLTAGPGNYYARVTGDCGAPVEANYFINTTAVPTYANLQYPASGTVCPSSPFDAYGQVYQAGITPGAGQGAGLTVEFGYNSTNTDPSTWTNWASATYNVDSGNNDEYKYTYSTATSGTYYYTFRYRRGTCDWLYGGYNAGGGGFWNGTTNVNGVLTVKTPVAITSATAAASPICATATTTLTANGVVGDGATVTWWSATGGTGTNYGTGLTLANAALGTYYARVTGDCGSPAETSVTVGTKFNVAITSATAAASPICATATTTLTANGVVGDGASVTWWSATGGTGTNYGTGLTLANAAPGTYYARVTGDCGTPAETSVTVGTKVNVAITSATAAASPICSTDTTTLTANGVVGNGASVTWWSATGGTGTNYGTGLTLANAAPGTYYAYVTGDCGTPAETSVTIGTKVNVAITSATAAASPICATDTTTLTANGVVGDGASVTWWSATGGTGTNYGTGLTLANAATGTYYAYVTGDCGTAEATVTVGAKTNVAITSVTAASNPICSGSTTTLTANGVVGDGATVTWYSATGGTGTNYGTGLTLTNAAPGTYYAYVTGDCGTPAESSITVTTDYSTWIGGTGNWNVAANWSCNEIPTITTPVIINSGVVTVPADAQAASITMTSTTILTVNSGFDLTVAGALNVASTAAVTIQNNANLLQNGTTNNNVGTTVSIKRNSSALFRLDYTMWSSPVSGTQSLAAFSPLTATNRYYTYNENTNAYVANNGAGTFTTSKGYLIRMPNNWASYSLTATPFSWTGTFIGKPNSGNISYAMDYSAGGYNAVGNPYPSAMSIDSFITDNSSNIEGTLWFWRKTNDANNVNSYSTCTAAGSTLVNSHVYPDADYVSPGQGFIVKAKSATDVNFTNSMRAGSNTNEFFRAASRNRFWLELKNAANVSYGQKLVAYLPNATTGYDNGYDGLFIGDSQTALLSVVEGRELVIQARPTFNVEDVIPLLFKTNAAGTYSVSLSQLEGIFNNGQDILLRDNQTGTVHNLSISGAYSFATEVGAFASRFEIIYQSALSTTSFNENSVVVYNNNHNIHINSGRMTMDKVKVFDVRGRLIIEKSKVNSSEIVIDGSRIANQVLLLQITSSEGTVVVKKIVN